MTELTGLPLRKAACEALGWRLKQLLNGYWSLQRPDGTRPDNWNFFHDDSIDAWEHAPAIESDPAVALPMLEDFCAKRNCKWELSRTRNSSAVICIITEFDPDGDENELANERGLKPAEAISRAIVEASKK